MSVKVGFLYTLAKRLVAGGKLLLREKDGIRTPIVGGESMASAIDRLAKLVEQAEYFGTQFAAGGASKLEAVAKLAEQIFLQLELFKRDKIRDWDLFRKGIRKVISGIADMLNAKKDDEIKEA